MKKTPLILGLALLLIVRFTPTSFSEPAAEEPAVGTQAIAAPEAVEPSPVLETVEPAPAVEAGEAKPTAVPLLAELEGLISELAARGITFSDDADRTPFYECIARVADPGAEVFSAEAYEHLQQDRMGHEFHPGIQPTISNGIPFIAGVSDAGADIQVGDRVVSIQGIPTTNVTMDAAIALLRSHSASTVSLALVRSEKQAVTTAVALVLSAMPIVELRETWPHQIGYARVNALTSGSGEELLAVMRAWAAEGFSGGILDLRGANGDDVASAALLASAFASEGSLLFSYRDRDDNSLTNYRASLVAPLNLPLMVLVDEKTTGAAEVFAVAAADGLRGTLLIGRPTAGDPCIRDGVPLPSGQVLYIATRKLVSGNGVEFNGGAGVTPNVQPVSFAADYEPAQGPDRRERLAVEDADRALRDRVRGDVMLQRAVDVLLGLKALNIRPGADAAAP